jgi:hypothetical protein
MSSFTASLFITMPRPFDDEQNLSAYALLFEGEKPYWELFYEGRKITIIPETSFIIEDCLIVYDEFFRNIPEKESTSDETIEVDKYYKANDLHQRRKSIGKAIGFCPRRVKILAWTGFSVRNISEKISLLKEGKESTIEFISFK